MSCGVFSNEGRYLVVVSAVYGWPVALWFGSNRVRIVLRLYPLSVALQSLPVFCMVGTTSAAFSLLKEPVL